MDSLRVLRLWYYGGNYETFLRVRAEQRTNQEAIASQQQRKVPRKLISN